MRIIDSNDNPIENPDLTLGYLKPETKTVHHDAVEAVEEVSHYETVAEYPNGGKDVRKVVDVPGVAAKDAYDEEVEVQRYVKYTDAELAQRKAEAEAAQKKQAEWDSMPTRVDALESANDDIILMMADLIGG